MSNEKDTTDTTQDMKNKISHYSQAVAREMASSKQALGSFMSKPRVWLEYGYSMARVWVELILRGSNKVIAREMEGSGLIVRSKRTPSPKQADSQSGVSGLRVLRYVLVVLMMAWMGQAMGEKKDFYYFIVNKSGKIATYAKASQEPTTTANDNAIPPEIKSVNATSWRFYNGDQLTFSGTITLPTSNGVIDCSLWGDVTLKPTAEEMSTLEGCESTVTATYPNYIFVFCDYNEGSVPDLENGYYYTMQFHGNNTYSYVFYDGTTVKNTSTTQVNDTEDEKYLWCFKASIVNGEVDPYDIKIYNAEAGTGATDYFVAVNPAMATGPEATSLVPKGETNPKVSAYYVISGHSNYPGEYNILGNPAYNGKLYYNLWAKYQDDGASDKTVCGLTNNTRWQWWPSAGGGNRKQYSSIILTRITYTYKIVDASGNTIVQATTDDNTLDVPDVIKSPLATYRYYSDAACRDEDEITGPTAGATTTIYVSYTTSNSLDVNGGTDYYVTTAGNYLYASADGIIGIEDPITSNADTRKWKITGNDAYQLTLQNVGNSNYINYILPSSENVTLSGMGSKFFLHQGTSGKYELVAVTNNDFTTTDYYTLGVDNGTLQLYSKTDHPFSDDEVQTSFCKDVASITVNPTAVSLTYTGGDQTLVTAGTALNGTMQYRLGNTGDYSNDIPTAKNAGSYEVYYKAIANSGYVDAIPSSPVTVVISKAPLTVTANNHTITYGDAPTGNGVSYTGFVTGDDESQISGTLGYSSTYTQYGDVGSTYTITPNGLTSDNYEITFAPGTLTVTQKEVGLEWGNTTLNYTGSVQVPTVTVTGLVNDDEIGVTVEGGQTDIGTGYTATATALTGEKAGNYKLPAENTTTSFSIRTPALTITANSYTIHYGDPRPNYAVTYDGFVNDDNASMLSGKLTYTCDYARGKDVGTYTITPGGLRSDIYEITFVAGTLTVNPKEVGLSWGNTTLTYTGTAQMPTATATGLVNDDEISVTVEVTGDHTDVGGYTATATALTGTKVSNYTLPTANTTSFSIVKAPLTVTANNHAITYGDAPAANGVSYTGFVNNETSSVLGGDLSYAYDYNQYDNVVRYNGNDEVVPYTITPNGVTSGNYDITFKAGTLTVNPKEVRLTWTGTSFPYDGEAHAPTVTMTEPETDLVHEDEITVDTPTLSANTGSSLEENGTAVQVGYYRATTSLTGTKAGNYKPVPAIQPFTISSLSIGDGNNPAEDIEITTTDGISVTVTDGETILDPNTHYKVEIEIQGVDHYITVTGKGNYSGSARILYVTPDFNRPTDDNTDYAAVYQASSDLAQPDGITPCIIKSVNPLAGTLTATPVDYLPKGVPVVLVAASDISGFQASAKPDNVTAITDQTKNSNLLKVSPTGGVTVAATQIYLFNAGEFVLTMPGTLPAGYFYLDNPNYHATGTTSGARYRLQMVIAPSTDINDGEWKMDDVGDDVWYTLDGRRLNGKPTRKGMYIANGKKIIIR